MGFGPFTTWRFKGLCVVLERDEWTVQDFADDAELSERQAKIVLDEFVEVDAADYEESKASFGAGREPASYHVNEIDMKRLILFQFHDMPFFRDYLVREYGSHYFVFDLDIPPYTYTGSDPSVWDGEKVEVMYSVAAWQQFVDRFVHAYDSGLLGKGFSV